MIDLNAIPCLQGHPALVAEAEPEAVESEKQEVQYARAPDGPGCQPSGRPAATQRNSR
jgi:hypothetical protein